MNNPYAIFNRVVLFTIQEYLERYRANAELQPLHARLRSQINGYLVFHKFSSSEAKEVIAITTTDEFKKICNVQVSDIVFALQMIKMYIENVPKQYRPHLNISDKKLIMGKATFALAMLHIRNDQPEKHADKKQIIDESVLTAKHVFAYLEKHFIKTLDI